MAPNPEILIQLSRQLADARPPVFLTGAGLSYEISPEEGFIAKYYNRIINKLNIPGGVKEQLRAMVEDKRSKPGVDNDELPYIIAETIITALIQNINECPFDDICDSTIRAKATLADAMGFSSNVEWLGGARMPHKNIYDRYRVTARFMVEDACSSYWTTNWDCYLERALEAIGVPHHSMSIHDLPWKHSYTKYLRLEHASMLADHIVIHKMHGCAEDLYEGFRKYKGGSGSDSLQRAVCRFMVQKKELSELDGRERGAGPGVSPTDQALGDSFRTQIRQCPLFVMGSKLYEPCVRSQITANNARPRGSLTVLDPQWNTPYHEEVACCYQSSRADCHLQCSCTGEWKTDDILLWLQTWYTFEQIKRHLEADLNDPGLQEVLNRLDPVFPRLKQQDGPCIDKHLFSFVDCFLPAWSRVVWRAGLVAPRGFDINAINLNAVYYYVPIRIANIYRKDLISAVYMLSAILDAMDHLDLSRFHGGIWQEQQGRLYLPIPYSNGTTNLDIEGIRPLRAEIGKDLSIIQKLIIIPINLDNPLGEDINYGLLDNFKRKTRQILGIPYTYENLDSIPLTKLPEHIVGGEDHA